MPKDTKQLLANYKNIPENLIEAIVKSNDTRKQHIATEILKRRPKTVGVYKLAMKANSDNFRASAIQGVINLLKREKIDIIIFEPTLKNEIFEGLKVINDLSLFKNSSDIIIANRIDDDIVDCFDKIYTRDIFKRD